MTPIPSSIAVGVAAPAVVIAQASGDIAAILIAIAALVTALGTSFVNILAAREVKRKVEENTKITEGVKAKTDVIEEHVNGASSAAKALIKSLDDRLTMAMDTIAKMDKTAALLAQAHASSQAPQPVAVPSPVVVVNEPHDPVPTETIKPPKQ